MVKVEIVTDLDSTGPIYQNVFRGTPRLAEGLEFLKNAVAEIERLSMQPTVGEALLDQLTDCMHASCGLSAMFFKYMQDGVSSEKFYEEYGYGYMFSTFDSAPEDVEPAFDATAGSESDQSH